MPSSSRILTMPPISPSVFFQGSVASSLASRQSGRIDEKILACFTWPAITTSVMPSSLRMSISLLSCPSESQCQWGASVSTSDRNRRKNPGMLHLAGHHHLGDALFFENVDQPAELPQRKPVAMGGQRLDFPGSFLLDGDHGDVVPQPPRTFKRQEGEASVAGDQPVAHYLTKPRSEERMKSISPSTSAQGATSARMRSMACEVLSCDLVSKRKAVCNDSMAAFSTPRRSRPTLLAPKTPSSGLWLVSEYGKTSCFTTLYGPINAWRPMRQNWCTPLYGLISTQSSIITCPAKPTLLPMMTWSPMRTS